MKHLILGTAGHIDHGKTSLVKALTGVDTDRLKEEKARGITIELGFAYMELPEGIRFGIIDVPGHEKFIRTMVAGVGGIDLVILAIAADEGIMPQTKEHLEICQLLGVKKGLIALTKADMVNNDWLELVTAEIRAYLSGSFLGNAPIVAVSSRNGKGFAELKRELATLAMEIEEKIQDGSFRLPVDRIFTVNGFGTVVTGTLLSGKVRVGDEVDLLPAGIECKVRGIQSYNVKTEAAIAGQRVAVNLQGVNHDQVLRGDVVVPRGVYKPAQLVDVRFNYLKSAMHELKRRSTFRLHSATYEVLAQVILIDNDVLSPGDSAYAQLRLARPVLLLPGDTFLLRAYSPQTTLGGGTILDPNPPRRRRFSGETITLLKAMETGSEIDKIKIMITTSLLSGLSLNEIMTRTGISLKKIEASLAKLVASGDVIQMSDEPRIFLGKAAFEELKSKLVKALQNYLRDNTMKEGIGKEELKSHIPKQSNPRFFGPLLSALEKKGKIVLAQNIVRLARHKEKAGSDQSYLQAKIACALLKGGMEPPTIKELCETYKCQEKQALEHLNLLVRDNKAIKIKSNVFYAPGPIAAMRETLTGYLRDNGEIIPSELRNITGLSRKFMIPILEYFDQEKLTIRVGDKRILRKTDV